MTYFIGIDPGRTTGYALWHPVSETFEAWQSKDPYEVMGWLEALGDEYYFSNLKITVEKYTGGGYKTADGTYTSELVGFFTHYIKYTYGLQVRNPISQQRNSGMERMRELIDGRNIPGPHSHDALAHAIVHARLNA